MLATPTGSTAYSLSAGGSIVHPSVPCMLFTPVSPHSLSCRPVIFPDSVTLRLQVPMSSRSTVSLNVDGVTRATLDRGDSVIVKVSPYPVLALCDAGENEDWIGFLRSKLNWNLSGINRKPSFEENDSHDSS